MIDIYDLIGWSATILLIIKFIDYRLSKIEDYIYENGIPEKIAKIEERLNNLSCEVKELKKLIHKYEK